MVTQIAFTDEPRYILWPHLLPCTISILSVINDYPSHSPPLHSLSGPVAKSFHTFHLVKCLPVQWSTRSREQSFHILSQACYRCFVLVGFWGLFSVQTSLQSELWCSELPEQLSSCKFLSPLPWIESLFCESLSWFTSLFWLSIAS